MPCCCNDSFSMLGVAGNGRGGPSACAKIIFIYYLNNAVVVCVARRNRRSGRGGFNNISQLKPIISEQCDASTRGGVREACLLPELTALRGMSSGKVVCFVLFLYFWVA